MGCIDFVFVFTKLVFLYPPTCRAPPIEPVIQVVPVEFRFNRGGNRVFISGAMLSSVVLTNPLIGCFEPGSFNNWSEQVSMHQVGGTWLYTALLARGRHQVKFIVDGRWEVSNDLPTLRDERRNINNFIDANPGTVKKPRIKK